MNIRPDQELVDDDDEDDVCPPGEPTLGLSRPMFRPPRFADDESTGHEVSASRTSDGDSAPTDTMADDGDGKATQTSFSCAARGRVVVEQVRPAAAAAATAAAATAGPRAAADTATSAGPLAYPAAGVSEPASVSPLAEGDTAAEADRLAETSTAVETLTKCSTYSASPNSASNRRSESDNPPRAAIRSGRRSSVRRRAWAWRQRATRA